MHCWLTILSFLIWAKFNVYNIIDDYSIKCVLTIGLLLNMFEFFLGWRWGKAYVHVIVCVSLCVGELLCGRINVLSCGCEITTKLGDCCLKALSTHWLACKYFWVTEGVDIWQIKSILCPICNIMLFDKLNLYCVLYVTLCYLTN